MENRAKRLLAVGGVALVASAVLFLVKSVLDLIAGSPPATGAEILHWVAARKTALALANEVYFFAIIALVPGVIGLYRGLADTQRVKAAIGCGIIAILIPVMSVLDIVGGRLVFPVYGLEVRDAPTAELVVALYYGGLHAVALLFAIATIVLALAMRRGVYGAAILWLGIAAGVGDVIGSYPWLIPLSVLVASQLVFSAWLALVGASLFRQRRGVTIASERAAQ